MSGVTTDATTVQLVEPPAAATTPTRPKPLRLSFCHNGGQRKGQPQSTALVVPIADQVLATAANKLKLKKKDVARARLFIWGSGQEIVGDATDLLKNDDLQRSHVFSMQTEADAHGLLHDSLSFC